MKKGQKQAWDANTLCILYYHSMTLPTVESYTMHAGRGGVIYRDTESVRIPCLHVSVLFSPVIPISYQNICKMFLFTIVCILFSAPYAHAHKYERAK